MRCPELMSFQGLKESEWLKELKPMALLPGKTQTKALNIRY